LKRTWILAVLLFSPVWADDRELVGSIFRRPEFLWKSEEKQPSPPQCQAPYVSDDDGFGGTPDRSGLVHIKDGSEGTLIGPEGQPPEDGTPSDQGPLGTSTPTEQGDTSATPSDPGAPSETASPTKQGDSETSTPTPTTQGAASDTGTPTEHGIPSESATPTEQSDPSASASATPTEQSDSSGSGGPSETSTPSDQGSPSETGSAPAPAPAPPAASATPELPDHPPPPLDYPNQPGLLEKLARWWSGLFGRSAPDGTRHILLLLRDLAALLLLVAFLRQLVPLLRQLRNWFKSEAPRGIAIEENSPEPEVLPEWRHLWRQAGELERQGRPALAQRLSYLAVLSFLDHDGHIRYRPGATNREYVYSLESGLREPFARITQRFERCRYGGHPPDLEEFQARCREVLPP